MIVTEILISTCRNTHNTNCDLIAMMFVSRFKEVFGVEEGDDAHEAPTEDEDEDAQGRKSVDEVCVAFVTVDRLWS